MKSIQIAINQSAITRNHFYMLKFMQRRFFFDQLPRPAIVNGTYNKEKTSKII